MDRDLATHELRRAARPDLGLAPARRRQHAVYSGSREVSRASARAIHDELPDLDGLVWASSVLGRGRAVVLWSGARDRYPPTPDLIRPLSAPALHGPLTRAARILGYEIV